MKKRFILLVLVVVFSFTHTTVLAYGKDKHNEHLELVLFGSKDYSKTQPTDIVEAITALKNAVYLAVDQFQGDGLDELKYLDKYRVPRLPKLSEIDYGSNYAHRKFTHRGWDYHYNDTINVSATVPPGRKDFANWSLRKRILVETTSKVFGFGGFWNFIRKNNDPQCNSFSAFLYYIHTLGDHLHRENYNNYNNEHIMELGHGIDKISGGIVQELILHIPTIFQSTKNTQMLDLLIKELESIKYDVLRLEFSREGVNNEENFRIYKGYAQKTMDILQEYIPKLLKKEPFFQKIIFPNTIE